MIMWDNRLADLASTQQCADVGPPTWADNAFVVGDSWDIGNAFLWVGNYARSQGGLDALYIMCHGYYTQDDSASLGMCMLAVGGFGLALCKQGLVQSTLPVVISRLSGCGIKAIVIFACGAASDQGNHSFARAMWQQLAVGTGATVYGADREQLYTITYHGATDFGQWEGTVWQFNPDNTVLPVESNPSPYPI